MLCPFCADTETKVIDSRLVGEGNQVRRRRECQECGERFTTFETAELVLPRVIKNNGSRQPFDEEKLKSGLLRALEKRPVSLEVIEATIDRIKHRLRAAGEREVVTRVVGEMVMDELRELDDVGYVRFASVYRSFQDVNEFTREIEAIDKLRSGDASNDAKAKGDQADSKPDDPSMMNNEDSNPAQGNPLDSPKNNQVAPTASDSKKHQASQVINLKGRA